MPTKNAHHTHEDASGQNATLPNFSFAFFRACRPKTRNLFKIPTNSQRVNQAKT